MIRINSLKIPIKHTNADVEREILKRLKLRSGDLIEWQPVKISIDARKKDDVKYIYAVDATVKNETAILKNKAIKDISPAKTVIYKDPVEGLGPLTSKESIIIVGAGPAGLICAYKLAKAGLKPLLIERGAPVDERFEDVTAYWQGQPLKPDSNVQFGEGGAGTFSDGKLNTMVHDDFGRMREVFRIFVENGADPSIQYINKPHIGTDKLRAIVQNIRKQIIALGGQVRFHTKMTDIRVVNQKITSIIVNDTETLPCDRLILAIGHSARDTFSMLASKGIAMEPKPFAIGLRVQHSQELISRNQYGSFYKDLPAADYKLTYTTSKGRGVYSFCMCPGGFVVNSSSEPEAMVVNGMSNSDRSEATANSALVVNVNPEDFGGQGIMAGVEFQRRLERAAYRCGQGLIPVQYLADFKNKKISESLDSNLPNTKGGYKTADLNECLPDFVCQALLEAFPAFGRTIKGYDRDDTLLLGVETRTSSPIRINRNDAYTSTNISGLYPCGEGAGYAGGITSAGMDGIKIYEAIVKEISLCL